MSNNLSLDQKFKINIDNFTKVLQALCEQEYASEPERRKEIKMLMLLAKQYLDAMPNDKLIMMFVEKSKSYWLKIYHKDKNFFQTELVNILGFIDGISQIFTNIFAKLTDEIEAHIWKWVNVLVKQAIEYVNQYPKYHAQIKNFDQIYKLYHN